MSFTESLDRLKESFLWAAAQGGNVEDCDALIAIGADVNWRNADGDTPLLAACRRGHSSTVALLLARGADCDIRGHDSYAPIHICTRRGDNESLIALLEANCNIAATNNEGQTALDIAKLKGFTDIYSALMGNRARLLPRPAVDLLLIAPTTAGTGTTILPTVRRSVELPAVSLQRSNSSTTRTATGNETANLIPLVPLASASSTAASGATSNIGTVGAASVIRPKINDSSSAVTLHSSHSTGRGSNTTCTSAVTAAPRADDRKSASYTIANQQAYSNDDPALASLRNTLERETAKRKALESKLDVFKDQNTQLLKEFSTLNNAYNTLQNEARNAENAMQRLLGRPEAVSALASVGECEELERTLKSALEAVEDRKNALIRKQFGGQDEQRLCVICQERDKSVVLLPCRHLCICDQCAEYDQLRVCPLCRREIESKFAVYS